MLFQCTLLNPIIGISSDGRNGKPVTLAANVELMRGTEPPLGARVGTPALPEHPDPKGCTLAMTAGSVPANAIPAPAPIVV